MRRGLRIAAIAGAGLAGLAVVFRSCRPPRATVPLGDPIRELARILTECRELPEILAAIERSVSSALGLPLAIFLQEGDQLRLRHHSSEFRPTGPDLANAARSISHPHRIVDRVPGGCCYFLPLTTWRGTAGVFALRVPAAGRWITARKWALVESFAHQTSLALLRHSFEDEARQTELLAEADRLQKALLNSIAHNVRTPLSSIIGSLSALQEQELSIDQSARRELINTAREEADRLNRLLGNLLDLSRLEAGVLRIRKDPCDVQDVIGAALEQLGPVIQNRVIQVLIAPEPAFVRMDFVLIVQVLVNLLDNALKYSPTDTSITVEARVLAKYLEIRVSDFGTAVAEHELSNIFEKFNRGGRSSETGGIGLGLSICKGLIGAHHGEIWAERRHPCGTTVTFTVPIEQQA
jgi:two-component system sensor histidine kinase KdpD